ncbi:MAG TPA: thiamine pyrophosphate-dependent dehydrogenase E1 component subunit alpha [Gemmatimonadaceae bacterium]
MPARGGARGPKRSSAAAAVAPPLSRQDKLDLYFWMRLTRTLEERLVILHRQNKVVGGVFRSLGQEADAVGSAFALQKDDVVSSLTRNLGSLLVKGATPVEVIRQHVATADAPARGRDLGLHFADISRGFIGHISPLGDMVAVMAGVTLSFKVRGEARVGLVYVGEGATSTGAFHEGINFAAVQKCPLVVVAENNGYAYSTPTAKQSAARQFVDKAGGYGVAGDRVDGNDVLAVHDVTKRAVDRARSGGGVTLIEMVTYRRRGHAEHDNQSYVPAGEVERWAAENDPIDRFVRVLVDREKVEPPEIAAIDARVNAEVDKATDEALASPPPEGPSALGGVFASPSKVEPHWYRS